MEAGLVRVLDTLPGMVFTALSSGIIDFVNKALVEFTGIPLAGTSGWNWPIDAELTRASTLSHDFRSMLLLADPFEMEMPIRRADGASRSLLVRCNPTHDMSAESDPTYRLSATELARYKAFQD